MNPIVRMMKRYIKMPLKKALPLLFISALVLVSTAGCTSSTNPTATPTATAATHDALLEKFLAQVPNVVYTNDANHTPPHFYGDNTKNVIGEAASLNFEFYPNKATTNWDSVEVKRFNNVANATADYNQMINGTGGLKSVTIRTETPTYWGLSYFTNATGHAPTTQKAMAAYVGGDNQQHQTVIQYDNFIIWYTHEDNPNGTS